ncbi:MAG: hypothetical protein AAB368_17175, partial [bacterium]
FADRALWGKDPAGPRAVNLALHAANALLLWRILVRLAPSAALGGALLWALHPVHSEVVQCVAFRNSLLLGFGVLGGTLAWLRGRPTLALAGWIVALLSKEAALAFPAVLICLQRQGWRVWRWWVPPFLLYIWWWGGSVPRVRAAVVGGPFAVTWTDLCTALSVLPRAAELIAAPWRLAIDHQVLVRSSAADPSVLAGAALVAGALWCAVRWWQYRPLAAAGLVWALAFYLPAWPLLPMGFHPLAERFLYLPLAGLVMVGAAFWDARVRLPGVSRRWALAALVLASGYAIRVMDRLADWTDGEALYSSNIRRYPGGGLSRYYLGASLQAGARWAEAVEQYRLAVRTWPGIGKAWLGLGMCLVKTGRPEDAARALR